MPAKGRRLVVHGQVPVLVAEQQPNGPLSGGRQPPAEHRAVFGIEGAGQIGDAGERPERQAQAAPAHQTRAVQLVRERGVQVAGGTHSRGRRAASLKRVLDGALHHQRQPSAGSGARGSDVDDQQALAGCGLRQLGAERFTDETGLPAHEVRLGVRRATQVMLDQCQKRDNWTNFEQFGGFGRSRRVQTAGLPATAVRGLRPGPAPPSRHREEPRSRDGRGCRSAAMGSRGANPCRQ